MRLPEAFHFTDQFFNKETYNVLQEVKRMVIRLNHQLDQLQINCPKEIFEKAALSSTEQFKEKLKRLLADYPETYKCIIGFLSGKISEFLKKNSENISFS